LRDGIYEFIEGYLSEMFASVNNEVFNSVLTEAKHGISETSDRRFVIIVGMTGQYNGRIILEMNSSTSDTLLQRMNFGDPVTTFQEQSLYLGELGNMVGGKFITAINNSFKGLELRLTPPVVFSGEGLSVVTPEIVSIVKNYSTDFGFVRVDIGIEGVKACLNLEHF
jgi:chemotaxis protein CheX